MPIATGKPRLSISMLVAAMARKRVDPIEMSMLPVMITNASPVDMTSQGAALASTVRILPPFAKFGVAKAKKTRISTNTVAKP